MGVNKDLHYCKQCNNHFLIDITENMTGDFFLQCPGCKSKHYRSFYRGEAVNCDLALRKSEPKTMKGHYGKD